MRVVTNIICSTDISHSTDLFAVLQIVNKSLILKVLSDDWVAVPCKHCDVIVFSFQMKNISFPALFVMKCDDILIVIGF